MSDSEIDAYLEHEIERNKGIVTYRLLSRRFAIHVNTAKNALTTFYLRKREHSKPIYATFWLSGEPMQQSANGTVDAMDVDNETNTNYSARKILIVGEEDLESTRASFIMVHAVHVYSLSAAPLQRSSELCRPSHEIRNLDRSGDADFVRSIGKIISQHVKLGKAIERGSKASSSTRPQANTPTLAIAKSMSEHTIKEKPKTHQGPVVPLEKGKLKASGTLSWANAKTKDVEKKPMKVEAKEKPIVGTQQKRGTKRKSDVVSHPQTRKDEEEEKKDTKPGQGSADSVNAEDRGALVTARIKKGVILTDDEEEHTTKYSDKQKVQTAVAADTELSLRAMMDIDDSNVVKASKPSARAVLTQDEEEEGPPTTDQAESVMDENSESDDPAPKAKARPRKQKKNAPIGKNGLRKKRVVKSKTDFDEKGYMVTVDYSSYESVDEEEEEEDVKKSRTKLKSATLRKASTKRNDHSALESETKLRGQDQSPASASSKKTNNKRPSAKPPAPKGRQSNGSQKNIASFFGSGGGK